MIAPADLRCMQAGSDGPSSVELISNQWLDIKFARLSFVLHLEQLAAEQRTV